MSFVPAADTVKVDATYILFAQQVINTFWFRKRAGAPDVTDLIALGEAFNTFIVDDILTALSQDITYIGCVVADQSSISGAAIEAPITPVAGSVASDALPGAMCACVTFLTAGRGRSARGRNYVSGVPLSVRTGNNFSAGFGTDLVNNYNAILDAPFDADWEWVVASHITGGADRPTALLEPVLGTRVADLNLDCQRRRLTGRGT